MNDRKADTFAGMLLILKCATEKELFEITCFYFWLEHLQIHYFVDAYPVLSQYYDPCKLNINVQNHIRHYISISKSRLQQPPHTPQLQLITSINNMNKYSVLKAS